MQPDVRRAPLHKVGSFRSFLVHIQLFTVWRAQDCSGGIDEIQICACWTCCTRRPYCGRNRVRNCRSPHFLQLRTLRALLWSAARGVVSVRHRSTDGTATASVATVMACVEITDTTPAIAPGSAKGGFGPLFPTRPPT